ncbi:OmpH family outer membrane protein [Marinomonas balearica]|uniref:Periplasmic chaperone for outer membrane proteins Skp n=1 Tax=Marinomonas balearica TaxID=491947 RepID=A0A4R6M578_9GAMM|nr:OmpH family outer membrane protein [Marinomonas balearica]TDO96394.1 periplasmic chaperone for outer membrane proteins Skp [Marinomonas balearica]
MKLYLLALLAVFSINVVNATEVAVVDMRAALLQSSAGQEASQAPRSQVQAMEARLNKEKNSVNEMIDAFKRDELTLSQEQAMLRKKEISSAQAKVRNMEVKMQRQAQALEQNVIKTLLPKGEAALKAIIETQKLDLVLNRQVVIYAGQSIDITSQLVEELNKGK